MRELYEADFHKLGIYGNRRVWVNAWEVFHRMPSRVACDRRAAVDFVVCFGWGDIFSVPAMSLHFQHSFVDPISEQPAWTRRRGSHSQPICPQKLAPTYPHQVYRLVCSHPRNLASAVGQYSSSQPASPIFDTTSECKLNKSFSRFKSASRICSRERKLR